MVGFELLLAGASAMAWCGEGPPWAYHFGLENARRHLRGNWAGRKEILRGWRRVAGGWSDTRRPFCSIHPANPFEKSMAA